LTGNESKELSFSVEYDMVVSGAWNAFSTSIVRNSFSGAGLIVAGIITETELIEENEMLSIEDSSLSSLVESDRVIE
jgi:hypothetical protein